jgi:cytochrome c oxidase subunit IV
MSEANEVAHRGKHGASHAVPLWILAGVFASLAALTVLTVAASKFDFGEYNLVIALAIAVVKASLVVLFFMHLRWDKPFNAVVFLGCLFFVGLFIGLTLLDTVQNYGGTYRQQAPGVKHVPLGGGGGG